MSMILLMAAFKGKCGQVRVTEEQMLPLVMAVRKDHSAIARTVARHNLAMAGEALALMVLESYHRKHRSRAIRVDDAIVVAAADNVLKEHAREPFMPTRTNLRRLNSLAKEIATNRNAPTPKPWAEIIPLGVA